MISISIDDVEYLVSIYRPTLISKANPKLVVVGGGGVKWVFCSKQSHGIKSTLLENKLHTGTSKTKRLHPVRLKFSLFCMSQCVACSPARWILVHVTVNCKGPITYCTRLFYCLFLQGTVIVIANHGDRIDIPSGSLLENKIVSGNLRILQH